MVEHQYVAQACTRARAQRGMHIVGGLAAGLAQWQAAGEVGGHRRGQGAAGAMRLALQARVRGALLACGVVPAAAAARTASTRSAVSMQYNFAD